MGLDTVEMAMSWENTFGIALEDSELARLRTPRQAIDLITSKLRASDSPSFCPPMRAFHLIRSGVRKVMGDGNKRIRLSDTLHGLEAGGRKKEFWPAFGGAIGIEAFRRPRPLFRRATVRDAVELLVACHLKGLLKPSEAWTRSLVRYGVRYAVVETVGVRDFSDDDRFVEEIGMD